MDVYNSPGSWVAVGFLLLIGLIAIFGNVLLVYLVIAKQDLRENLNYFVLSLAAVDLLTALLIMPLQSYHSAVEVSTDSALCVCINVLAVMAAMASVLSLICVTFDRYLVISKPLRYVTLVTGHRVLGTISFLWMYSIGVSLLILMPDEVAVEPPMGINNSSITCNIDTLIGLPYGYFLMCNFFIPIPAMFIMYAHIFVIARRHARAIHDMRRVSGVVDPARPQPSLFKQNVRIAAVLSVITTYFILSWTSTIVILAVMRHMPEHAFILTIVYKIIFYTNAAFNPFLYMFHHKTLRSYLIKMVRRKFSRVPPGTVEPSSLVSTVSLDVPRPARINSLFEPPCNRRPAFRLQQNLGR